MINLYMSEYVVNWLKDFSYIFIIFMVILIIGITILTVSISIMEIGDSVAFIFLVLIIENVVVQLLDYTGNIALAPLKIIIIFELLLVISCFILILISKPLIAIPGTIAIILSSCIIGIIITGIIIMAVELLLLAAFLVVTFFFKDS